MDENWIKDIQDRANRVPISSGRSKKLGKISFDDLVFVPTQLPNFREAKVKGKMRANSAGGKLHRPAKRPVDYYREKINSKVVIGKRSKKPIEIETPIIIGAMSFGALSKEAKIALAKASTIAGTIENTGEGGVLPEERKFSRYLIVQYSTGRFGITEEVLKKADAIEIKLGQGAKPGMGGLLSSQKVTKEIALIRGVSFGKEVHSPAFHPDIKNAADLKKKVSWLRKITGGVPVIIKIAAGNIEEDIRFILEADPDVIAIDGLEGGTGAAPEAVLDDVGIPAFFALLRARRMLDKKKAQQELWIGGGLNRGSDFAKALALGADACFVATPLLVAMGCICCRQCYSGKCPKGIATQDEKLRKNFEKEKASQRAADYIKNCTEEIKMLAAVCGKKDINNLSKTDLRALNENIAKIAGVKLASD